MSGSRRVLSLWSSLEMTRAWTRSCAACSVRKGLIFLMLCSLNLQDRAVFAMCSAYIRKIRPFLTEHAAQLLVQALVISRLDYCNALLAGLPSNTIKPLQMIQNAAARLVFNEPMLHLSSCSSHPVQDTDACI